MERPETLTHLLTSFEGRIGRQQFWVAGLLCMAVGVIGMFSAATVATALFGPGSLGVRLTVFLAGLAYLYPSTALTWKRVHDRNSSAYYIVVLVGVVVCKLLTDLLGLTGPRGSTKTLDYVFGVSPTPNTIEYVLGFATLVLSIWCIVDLGCLRGTNGPNRYGPDPLARAGQTHGRVEPIRPKKKTDLVALYLSFEGRINRKPYWLATLGMMAIGAFVGILLVLIFRIPLGEPTWSAFLSGLAMLLVFLYPAAALTVKRLHDRNKSGYYAILILGLQPVNDIMQFTGAYTPPGAPFNRSRTFIYIGSIVLLIIWVLVILWFLIELGFLRGTRGPNRYGPDPLAPAQSPPQN